jgi:hypothetical protein
MEFRTWWDLVVEFQPKNILPGIEDDAIRSKFEQTEAEAPLPRKTLEDHTIYSHNHSLSYGTSVLCDLGEAQEGDNMPDIEISPVSSLSCTLHLIRKPPMRHAE